VADYLKAECFAVSVVSPRESAPVEVDKHLDFARRLHIETRVLEGEDVAQTLVDLPASMPLRKFFLPSLPSGRYQSRVRITLS